MNVISQFIELVKISSPSGHEEKMSIYLQAWLKKNGFRFNVDKVGNIYAANNKEGVPLLFCTHMDTVSPGININPVIKNGVITSDGTTILGADNKAAIAALLCAIEQTFISRSIELIFTVREETGGGIEFFPFHWIKSKKALTFDSAKPLGGIIMRSPYIYNFNIDFMGVSAHASTPESGINAFTPAFHLLSTLSVGSFDNGETTINIGLIDGGTGVNTVPNSIHIVGEVRSYNKQLFATHLKSIQKRIQKYAKKYGVKSTCILDGHSAGYVHQNKHPLVDSLSRIFSSLDLPTILHTHSGISDANILNSQGIETFNLTDGVQFPHTTTEQINVKSIEKLSEIIKKCMTQL